MPPTVTFDAGDVVVVPFPFTDRATSRRRPALVVSNRPFNDHHAQVVLAMITTATNPGWPSDTPIGDRDSAGLNADSIIRLKFFTLDQSLVQRRIGGLGKNDSKAVRDSMKRWLL